MGHGVATKKDSDDEFHSGALSDSKRFAEALGEVGDFKANLIEFWPKSFVSLGSIEDV